MVRSKHPSKKYSGHSSTTSSLDSLAIVAMKQIDDIESKLDLDIVVPPNDKNQIRAVQRVSPAALRIAADIVGAAPERFPEFVGFAEAAAYVETMLPLADRALALANHIQKSIQNHHAPAALKTLALYSVAKGLGRLADNETMREKVELLKAEVAPRHKKRLTNEEKALRLAEKRRVKRVAKAMKVLVDNGASFPTSPAATPAAPGPTAAAPKTNVAPAATSSALAN